MWRLLLSGLLCVPALVLLITAPRDAHNQHVQDAPILPLATAAEPPIVTVSLSPALLRGEPSRTGPAEWELAFAEGLAAAVPADPTPPHWKPTRVLHARRPVPRDALPLAVAPPGQPPPTETAWARLVHWLSQHQAPRDWSAGGGEGAG
jgi:hypothetical protein